MRLLVIGGSGFLGRHLVRAARAGGHEVVGTSRRGADGLVPFNLARDRVTDALPSAFLSRRSPLAAVLAAFPGEMDAMERDPGAFRPATVDGTMRAIEDLDALGAKMAFVSTSFVFDGIRGNYAEEDTPNPLSEYGRQKLAVEQELARRFPATFVPRLDKLVSDDPSEKHMFQEWYDTAAGGRPIACIANQVLSVTLVDDVARAILAALEAHLHGIYHVANPEAHSREALAREFLQKAGMEAPVVSKPQRDIGLVARRPERSNLNAARFQSAIPFSFTPMQMVIANFLKQLPRSAAPPGQTPRSIDAVRAPPGRSQGAGR